MVDIFPELNQKMFTVKLMEKPHLHQVLKLSQEELNKNHMLNTIPVSEVNLLIMLKLPILLRLLLKS
jgi:hypothetical protein